MTLRSKWPTFVICGAWLGVALVFCARSSVTLQLALALLTFFALPVVFLKSIGFALNARQILGAKAFVPVAVVVATGVAVPLLAPVAQELYFRSRLADFQPVIETLGAQAIAPAMTVPVQSPVAAFVLAERTAAGHLQVQFVTGLGFPVRHNGYLYVESGEVETGSLMDRRLPNRHRVRPQWFRFSD